MPRRLIVLCWLLLAPCAPAQRLSLDGTWELCRSAEPVLPAGAAWQSVQVPSFQGQDARQPFLWYRRSIAVPEEYAGKRLFLRFEGVRFVSEVSIDGRKAGGHRGGWEPFELDVTSACQPGRAHQVLVRVQDLTGLCSQPVGKEKLRPGERFIDQLKDSVLAPVGSQYSRTGIWQPVSLLARNDLFVEDVFVKTSVRRKEIAVEVTVRNLGPTPQTVCCRVAVQGEGGPVFQPLEVRVPAGQDQKLTVAAPWVGARLWRPEDPHLHQLVTRLELGGRELDRHAVRFGFREFWTDGPKLILNGTPMNFLATAGHPRGELDGELSKQGAFDLFRRIREAGCVAMRLHANIWPRDWYDAADEAGMPIILESALFCFASSYALTRDEFWKNYQDHLAAVVRAHRNHPSVVMTSLENEILHCGGERLVPATVHRLAEAGRMVKALDPTRPILFDGDDDPEGVADVVNLHYPLDFNKQNLWPDAGYWLESGMEVACYPHRFWGWDRKKPLYLGEFLHIQHYNEADPYSALLGDDAWRGHADAMARAKAMAWEMQIEAYRACGVSGMCPWTLLETGPFPSDQNSRYLAVKRAYEKNAAFVRQYDCRFYAGETVDRTVYLHNDTPSKARLQCSWELAAGGKVASQGSQTFDLEPAASQRFGVPLAIPAVQEETALQFTIRVSNGEKQAFSRSWPYRAYPRRPLRLPQGLRLAVLGELPANLSAMLGQAGAAWTKVPGLDQLPQEGVVLVAPHALDHAAPSKAALAGQPGPLELFVSRGGSVVVLEQDRYPDAIPARLTDRACTVAFRRSADSQLLAGLGEDDFRFWRGDHVVARKTIRKPASGRFRALVDSGGRDGLVYVPWLEIASGRGRYLLCQLAVGEKLGSEPAAQLVLENLLACAATGPAPAPSRLAVVEDKLPLTRALEEIDAPGANLSGRLAGADLSSCDVLLLETDALEIATCRDKLAGWIRAGGRAILHGGTPGGFGRLAEILPEPVALQAVDALPVNIARPDPLIDGLTNQELYWYGSREGLGSRQLTPLSGDVVKHAVVAGLPAAPSWTVLEPGSFAVQSGKSSLRDGSLYMGTAGVIEREVEFPAGGRYAVGLTAKGTPLHGVYPLVDVLIDGRRQGGLSPLGAEWGLSWCSVAAEPGRHKLALRFANDEWNPVTREDRNLWIKDVRVASTSSLKVAPLLSPAALVAVPMGKGLVLIDQVRWELRIGSDPTSRYLSNLLTNQGVDFGGPNRGLRIPGDQFAAVRPSPGLRFHDGKAYLGTNGWAVAPATFARAGRYQFRIRAWGTPAAGELPNLALSIDGKQVADATLLGADWHTLTLQAEAPAGRHEIGLSLTNDLYRPPEDRNLRVEWLEIR